MGARSRESTGLATVNSCGGDAVWDGPTVGDVEQKGNGGENYMWAVPDPGWRSGL